MKKILFVCLGNICRSPMAEAIFNDKIAKKGLESYFSADSAGTANYHVGESPDPRTVETVQKNNISISHRGQQFKRHHASEFHYLIGMDQSNINNMMRELRGSNEDQVFLMRDFDINGKGMDVPDPWFGGIGGFDEVYDILDRSIDEFIHFIKEENNIE